MRNNDLGMRVAHYRNLNGLTQEKFANLLFKSKSWVQKFESGDRQSDPHISVLEDISRVLQIPLGKLLGIENINADSIDDEKIKYRIMQIETVMYSSKLYISKERECSVSIDEFRCRIKYLYFALQSSNYVEICDSVPKLLFELYAVPRTELIIIKGLLSRVYELIVHVLVRFGSTSLAVVAGERALNFAIEYGDPCHIALASQAFLYALMIDGKASIGLEIAENILIEYENTLKKEGFLGYSALGVLQLKCAIAYSLIDSKKEAFNFIQYASKSAEESGIVDFFNISFDKINIELHKFSIFSNLAMYNAASKYEELIGNRMFNNLTIERRTHFLVDMAELFYKIQDYQKSSSLLLHVNQLSSQEIRSRLEARRLLNFLKTEVPKSKISKGIFDL